MGLTVRWRRCSPQASEKITGGSVETVKKLYYQAIDTMRVSEPIEAEIGSGSNKKLASAPDLVPQLEPVMILEFMKKISKTQDEILYLLRRLNSARIPADVLLQAQSMRDKGATAQEVADQLSVSERWVYKNTTKQHHKGRSTEDEVRAAKQLRSQGLSLQRIADQLDRSKAWVRYHIGT